MAPHTVKEPIVPPTLDPCDLGPDMPGDLEPAQPGHVVATRAQLRALPNATTVAYTGTLPLVPATMSVMRGQLRGAGTSWDHWLDDILGRLVITDVPTCGHPTPRTR